MFDEHQIGALREELQSARAEFRTRGRGLIVYDNRLVARFPDDHVPSYYLPMRQALKIVASELGEDAAHQVERELQKYDPKSEYVALFRHDSDSIETPAVVTILVARHRTAVVSRIERSQHVGNTAQR